VKTKKEAKFHNGMYKLASSSEYELNVYHYHPSEGKSNAYLLCKSQMPLITPLTNPTMLVNSRYDMKHYRFLTARTSTNMRSILSMYRGPGESKDEIPVLDFDLNVQIKGVYLRKIVVGFLIGIALASPHITAAISNNQLSREAKIAVSVVSLLSSLLVGLLASFNLKRDM